MIKRDIERRSMASSASPSPQKAIALLLLLTLLAAAVPLSLGKAYKVGGRQGWTLGGRNLTVWSSSKKLHAGDSIVFQYDKMKHNVMMVKRKAFWACDTSSPMGTYTSGRNIIRLKRPAQLYYICGVPGQCQRGLRVWIKVSA